MGRRESQSLTSGRDEDPGTPPTTPVHTAHSSGASQEEEPEDLIFATPLEGNGPPGTPTDSPTTGKEDTNGNFLGPLDELAAPPNQPVPAGSPAGIKSPPPAEPEALTGDIPPSVGNGEETPLELQSVAVSTPPSSPVVKGADSPTVPPFQFTQPLNLSNDSRRNDFESPNGEVTRPYQRYLGKTSMRATDWTYYHAQEEADPAEYHPDWPIEMRGVGPIRVPVGSESNTRIPPLSPTYLGITLWQKVADLKQQKSWGNVQEQPGILQHMWTTDTALQNDPDWATTLRRCREDPTEDYLHTVLPTGEVLPFSEAVAIAYEYPCTLGKQQEGLHRRVVFSSTAGIPLITPALSGRLRLQDRRGSALELLRNRKDRVGYVGDEVCEEDRPNPDMVPNRWNRPGFHYECHHAEFQHPD